MTSRAVMINPHSNILDYMYMTKDNSQILVLSTEAQVVGKDIEGL